MSSTQDVRFNEEQDRPGPPARQQALQRVAARAAARARGRHACRRGAARRRRSRTRWILSRLQAAEAEVAERDRRLRVPPRRARRSTTSSTASCATGTWRCSSRACTRTTTREAAAFALYVLARDARARAPGDPVRDRGDLVATCPAPTDLLMAPPLAGGRRRRCATSRPRPRSARAIEADAGAARLARRRRRGARARASPRGWRPTATSASPTHVARLARFEFADERRRAGGDRRRPRRHRGGAARPTPSTWRPRSAARAERAERAARRRSARAEGKLANQGFVAKAPEAVVAGRARQARSSCRRSWRSSHDGVGRSAAPRSTCSRSSCSACASGWSACAGC